MFRLDDYLGAVVLTEQEFEGEERVDVVDEPEEDDFAIEFEETDDFAYDDDNE